MNRYLRALVVLPTGFLKTLFLKVFHPSRFKGVQVAQISPYTELTIDHGKLQIGKGFKMRDGSKIRVRKNACLLIGSNVSINTNNLITCHERIEIGDNVQLSPNVQIYDHDHDFRHSGGLMAGTFKTDKIIIGNNVWIGANTVILRGTIIGNNSVIAAGSVVKGTVPPNSVFIQERNSKIKEYHEDINCN